MRWIFLSVVVTLLSMTSVNAQNQTTVDELRQQLTAAEAHAKIAATNATDAEKLAINAEVAARDAEVAAKNAQNISEGVRLTKEAQDKAMEAKTAREEATRAWTAKSEADRQLAQAKAALIPEKGYGNSDYTPAAVNVDVIEPETTPVSRGKISFYFAGCEDLAKDEHGDILITVQLATGVEKYNAEKKKTEIVYENVTSIGSGTLREGFSFLVNDPKPGKYRIIIMDSDRIKDIINGGVLVGDAFIHTDRFQIDTNIHNNYVFTVRKWLHKSRGKKGITDYEFNI